MPEFYDTHAHLDFPDFVEDLPEVVQRAVDAGISRVITIGTDLESSRRAVELSERFSPVFAAVGWHPCHVSEAPEDIREPLLKLVHHPKVVAIGETGLDHYRLPSAKNGTLADDKQYKEKQADIFRQQLEVAAESGLNCVVHQRAAMDETLEILGPFSNRVRGVFHCFVGTAAEAQRILDLGSLVSFTGILTFKNAREVRETLRSLTPEGFMLETDCPYLAPVPFRGKRCEPAYVREISQVAAETRGEELETLSKTISRTAREFFRGLL